MAQVLQDAIDKKAGASKRSSDAAANVTGLATSAAAVAASKRSRASLSSGPVVGPGGLAAAFARQGNIGENAKATMALADMIHSEGLSWDFAQKRKVVAALEAFKATSKNYKTPGRQQADGPLLSKAQHKGRAATSGGVESNTQHNRNRGKPRPPASIGSAFLSSTLKKNGVWVY